MPQSSGLKVRGVEELRQMLQVVLDQQAEILHRLDTGERLTVLPEPPRRLARVMGRLTHKQEHEKVVS
jgi:hypothetical protein